MEPVQDRPRPRRQAVKKNQRRGSPGAIGDHRNEHHEREQQGREVHRGHDQQGDPMPNRQAEVAPGKPPLTPAAAYSGSRRLDVEVRGSPDAESSPEAVTIESRTAPTSGDTSPAGNVLPQPTTRASSRRWRSLPPSSRKSSSAAGERAGEPTARWGASGRCSCAALARSWKQSEARLEPSDAGLVDPQGRAGARRATRRPISRSSRSSTKGSSAPWKPRSRFLRRSRSPLLEGDVHARPARYRSGWRDHRRARSGCGAASRASPVRSHPRDADPEGDYGRRSRRRRIVRQADAQGGRIRDVDPLQRRGARQLGETLRWLGIELLVLPMAGFSIHLDAAFGMVDVDKALAHAPELPYWFLERLSSLGSSSSSAIRTSSGRSTRSPSAPGGC